MKGSALDLVEAWLTAGPSAVVSHESALSLHGLSNVVPASVHLTVPRSYRRVGRRIPRGVKLHTTTRPLRRDDIVSRGPVPATVPGRAIVDSAEAGTAPEQIFMAVRQALDQGLVTRRELLALARQRSKRVAQLVQRAIEDAADDL